MLQFSKRLASKGPRVTLVATSSISKSVKAIASHTINIEIISDGSTESITLDTSTDSDAFFENFKVTVSQSLIKLIETQKRSRHPPKFVVYDSGMPWALNLARELGLDGAPFFTQSGAVNANYYHGYKGTLKLPLEEPTVSLPSLPLLGANDLPSFMADTGTYRALFRTLLNQLSNIDEANWIFCNTVYELEDEVLNWMTSQWPVKTIGPTIPSIYLDKRLEDDKEYGLSLFKPEVDACLKWLDTMEAGSVIYISFGSLASLEADQMEELTLGLKNSNCHFLWGGHGPRHRHCFDDVGEDLAYCYSHGRGVASIPHFAWSILQHSLLVFESTGSFALDQVGLLNLDPLRCLNGKATKI
nr:udp-glycosyltransferase 74e1 [Quercus suber]